MKQLYFTTLLCATLGTSVFAQQPATMEDLNLATESYWNGADGSAMFQSGDFIFTNNFTDWGNFTSWSGFAYATFTSTQYASLSDQYNSCVGHGADGSATYAVAYIDAYATTPTSVLAADAMPFMATGCQITNAAYALTSMLNGDSYAKKFGPDDWFLLTATGYLEEKVTGTAEFYLAKDGQPVTDWQYFDLSALGQVDVITFSLSSSDNGQWGMNTPAYFCLDNFGDDHVTGIQHVSPSANADTCYDILGRRLSQPRGITVQGGKAMIVR